MYSDLRMIKIIARLGQPSIKNSAGSASDARNATMDAGRDCAWELKDNIHDSCKLPLSHICYVAVFDEFVCLLHCVLELCSVAAADLRDLSHGQASADTPLLVQPNTCARGAMRKDNEARGAVAQRGLLLKLCMRTRLCCASQVHH